MKLKNIYSLFLILATLLCSGSMWGEPVEITPESPYTNNFNTETTYSLPAGWTKVAGNTYNPGIDSKNDWSGYTRNSSAKALFFYGNLSTGDQIVALPQFSDDIKYLTVDFYYKTKSSSYPANMSVGYITNLSSKSTYVAKSSLSYSSDGWTHFSYTFDENTPDGAYIAISFAGTNSSSSKKGLLSVEDVSVTTSYVAPAGGCAKPKTLTKSADLPDGATFTWEQNVDETTYQWACVAAGADVETWNTLAENVRTKTITGLTAGTAYDFHVRSYCGDGENEQSASVKINFTPTCPAPTAPQIANPGTTTADLSWTAAAGITTYQYVAAISGQTPDWSNAQSVTDATSAQLTNLQPGKTYKAYVRSYFSATSISSAVETSAFQTECGAEDLPFNEYFSAANPCWKLEHCHGSTGVNSGRFRFYYTSSYPQYLISPELTTLANQVQVEFEYQNSSNTYPETFKVGYSTTTKDVANFTWGDEVTANDNSKAFTYSDVLPAGVKYIAIQCTSNNAYYLYIDNFSVSEYVAPACAAPTALAVSEIGTNSAKVTWNSEATEFALQYKKTSDANWTAANGDIASGYVLGGLDANETEYTVRVQAICGGTPSEWVVLANPFKTECVTPTVTELAAWNENFESQASDKKPACWSEVSSYAISAYTQVNASAAKDGSLGVQVYVYGTNTEIALLPTFTEEIKNLKISFDYKNYGTGSNYAALEVGYYNGGEFTNVTTLDKTTSFVASGEIEMPKTAPEGARIAFRVVGKKSNYNGSAYIDNISVIRKPACAVPTITAANATSDGAVVAWTPGDEESQWNLRYSVKDANVWTVAEDVTTGYAITGLTVGTTYEVQVQANCGGSQSAWTASANFTPVCNAPTALAVTARTQNSASFSWTSAESAWVLQYSTDGENWESENVAANPFTLTGLTAGQTYQAKIQTACGSEFSNIVEFTTWCDLKLNLPTSLTSFSAVPACWEVSPAGAVEIAQSKLCFTGAGEKFLYLPQTSINLNLLSATFTFSGSLEFGYIDAPNGAFHAFASQPTSGVEIDLADEADAPKYIAIRYNGASSLSSASISAISIRKTPTCLKPTAVAGTPGVGSAEISWTAGSETAWNLQYKLASAANWTDAEGTITNPYALSGLDQGVTYKVRVQANCGEELSDWSDEASFTTNCEGMALPWDANFSVALSNCWTVHYQNTSYIPSANTFSQDLQMNGGKNGASNNVVVLPAFATSLMDAMMTFEYRGSTGSQYAQLEAGYVTDKADTTTFVALETLDQAGTYTEARVALATVPTDAYLAFRYAGASSHGDLYIKNLRVANTAVFADADNNTATLAGLNGQTLDVVIGRTITRTGYFNTICLPFDMPTLVGTPLEGAELWAFKYAKVENEELLFRIVEASSIEAGVPYFIQFAAGDAIVNPLFKNVTIAASAGQKVGDENMAQLCGILQPEIFTPGDQTKLFLYNENALYWWNGASASALNSFRAYFKVVTTGAGAPARHNMPARLIKEEQQATGMESVQPSVISSQKILENGQVIIIRNGVKYSVQGQVIR